MQPVVMFVFLGVCVCVCVCVRVYVCDTALTDEYQHAPYGFKTTLHGRHNMATGHKLTIDTCAIGTFASAHWRLCVCACA